MNKKVLLAFAVLVCAFVPAVAQTISDDDVVKITTNLVQIDVVVTRNGRQVKDLKAEDFEIFEDGRRQDIVSFAYVSNVAEAPLPTAGDMKPEQNSASGPNTSPASGTAAAPPESKRRQIAFVIDDYGLTMQAMADVRRQLRKFIDEQLDSNDLIAIIRTSRARKELPQLTNDRSRINEAWEQVQWNKCSRVGVKMRRRVGDIASAGCGGEVASYNESMKSFRAIVTSLGHVPGRKSMVVFSNDMPLRDDPKFARGTSNVMQGSGSTNIESNNDNDPLTRVAELAIRSSVVIYGVDAGGLQTIGMTAADETLMPRISGSQGNIVSAEQLRMQAKLIQKQREGADKLTKETGGFLIKDQNEFQFDKILDDQSGYYLIGYRPDSETFNKSFHKLRARLKKSGYEVRTRSGFFGMSEEEVKRLKETKK